VIDTCSDPDIAAKVISENIPYTWTIADPSTGMHSQWELFYKYR